jgi:HlyD family secretion protein
MSMDRIIEKKKWTVKKLISALAVGCFIIFIIYLIFFSDMSRKLNVETERITISEVRKAPFQEYIPISGTVEPIQTFFLDLSEGGQVVRIFVEEGAFLKAGDPIIKLDNPNLSLQLMNTQSSFMLAESQLRQTSLTFEQNRLYKENQLLDLNMRLLKEKRTWENNIALYNKNLISKNEYETSKEQYEYLDKSRELMKEVLNKDSLTNKQLLEQNEAIVENSKNYLRLVQSQLKNLTVRAPISGQLTSLKAEIGQSVNSGYNLGQIDNTDSYKIRAEVDEHYISRVQKGLTAEYEFGDKTHTLTIKTVYPQVANGRFVVDLVFTTKQPQGIRRGQTVHARLELGELMEALLIENGGFYSTTGGQWIFVIDKSGTFAEKRSISIGRQNPQYFEVLEGLNPGEHVITSSYDTYGNAEKLILK